MPAPPSPISPEISSRRILTGGAIAAAGLFASQLSGFVRQAVIGFVLGTAVEADALTTAMAPVELWWSVLAITVIFGFVPSFTKDEYRLEDVMQPVFRCALISAAAIFVFAEPLVIAFAPGFDQAGIDRAVYLTRLLSPAPIAIGCGFVYSAFLMSRRRFALATAPHAIVNVATVVGALTLGSAYGGSGFCVGYTGGAYLFWAIAHLAARNSLAEQVAAPKKVRAVDLVKGPAPILGQALAMELNTVVTRAYASTFGPGMTAAFEFGFKLFRVPMALMVVPISQSLLPEIAALHQHPEQRSSVFSAVKRATLLTAVGAALVSVALIVLREPVVSILFERGKFGQASTAAVALILLSYAPSMMGRGVLDLLARASFGLSRFRAPLIASIAALLLNAVVCAVAGTAGPGWIGVGAIIGFTFGAAWLLLDVRRAERTQP